MKRSGENNFASLRQRFFAAVKNSQYSEQYQYFFEIRFSALENYMSRQGICDYTPATGDDFLNDFCRTHNKSSTIAGVKTFIGKVNDIYYGKDFAAHHSPVSPQETEGFEDALEDYASYCLGSGNKQSTLSLKIMNCRTFCLHLNEIGCISPNDIDSSNTARACLKANSQDAWRFIREFLRFLYENSYTGRDFSYIVPKAVKKVPLPSVYSTEEIQKMEHAVDTTGKTGKRDICMMLLSSRLTMRAGDIVKLTFDELDFDNERISYTQEKTGEWQSLPLLPEIKDALHNYIEYARPQSDDRHVFLSVYAPFRPLTTSVLRRITKGYMDKAGIDPAGRRHGSHIHRSSAATSMVNDGISYEVVKRILGHDDPNVIQYYASLDINNLRHCALPAPAATGTLKDLLDGRMAL